MATIGSKSSVHRSKSLRAIPGTFKSSGSLNDASFKDQLSCFVAVVLDGIAACGFAVAERSAQVISCHQRAETTRQRTSNSTRRHLNVPVLSNGG
jgi:hypothetical protein